MKNQQKKIAIIVCASVMPSNIRSLDDHFSALPEVAIIAHPQYLAIDDLGVGTSTRAAAIIDMVQRTWQQYDGFVIIAGVDDVLNLSALVSFGLTVITKPIVFSGCVAPTIVFNAAPDVGIKTNIINAVQVATTGIAEVCLMFGNRLVRATQAQYTSGETLNVVTGPASALLGRVDFSVRIFEKLVRRSAKGDTAPARASMRAGVVCTIDTPTNAELDFSQYHTDADVLIVHAGAYRTVPEHRLASYAAASVPVIVWHPLPQPDYKQAVCVVTNLTWHTALAKALFAPPRVTTVRQWHAWLQQDTVGELLHDL